MTRIRIRPNQLFGLSAMDRENLSCKFEHSFQGHMEFEGTAGQIGEDAPIVYLVTSLIEASLLVSRLELPSLQIPIPGAARDLYVVPQKGVAVLRQIEEAGGRSFLLDIPL